MNAPDWASLIKTLLIGTARAPADDTLLRQASEWSDAPPADPAAAALALLSALQLQRKAGFPLDMIEVLPVASGRPGHPPPPAAADLLDRILTSDRLPALDEFLGLLRDHEFPLPPEFAPVLLDRAVRDRSFFEKICPALGPLGPWLAAQNPVWQRLYEQSQADWGTGAFPERLQWLETARRAQPLVALARLESTWPGERAEHKLRFLKALDLRLSILDEDFLEKVLHREKRRELRREALRLLLQLPDGRARAEWSAFFRDRLDGLFAAKNAEKYLREALPDLEETPVPALVGLLPEEEVRDWRRALAGFLLAHLPPAATLGETPAPAVLERLAEEPELQAFFRTLVGAVRTFGDRAWLEALLRWQAQRPNAAVWDSETLGALVEALPPEGRPLVLTRVLQQKDALVRADAAAVRLLRSYDGGWSLSMLEAFAAQLAGFAYPVQHVKELLDLAAYRCRPDDAEALRLTLHPDRLTGWRYELMHFFDVIHFRRRMRAVFA